MELDDTTRRHIDRKIDDLAQELSDAVPRARVAEAANEALGELEGARFPDFLPILTYRFARERLTAR